MNLMIPLLTNIFVTMVLKILVISYFRAPFSLFKEQRSGAAIILQKYNLNNLINNLRLYLYGHRTINFAYNRIILLSAIAFIKDTVSVLMFSFVFCVQSFSFYLPL